MVIKSWWVALCAGVVAIGVVHELLSGRSNTKQIKVMLERKSQLQSAGLATARYRQARRRQNLKLQKLQGKHKRRAQLFNGTDIPKDVGWLLHHLLSNPQLRSQLEQEKQAATGSIIMDRAKELYQQLQDDNFLPQTDADWPIPFLAQVISNPEIESMVRESMQAREERRSGNIQDATSATRESLEAKTARVRSQKEFLRSSQTLAGYRRRRGGSRGEDFHVQTAQKAMYHAVAAKHEHRTKYPHYQPLKNSMMDEPIPETVAQLIKAHSDECKDKLPLLLTLHDAGQELSLLVCRILPKWSQVVELYGDGPAVLGLDTCDAYRRKMRWARGAKPSALVAALWNTGSTALSTSFLHNLYHTPKSHIVHATVPWGKHSPLYVRLNNTYPKKRYVPQPDMILPVLIVRDPYRWMQSMCQKHYKIEFEGKGKIRCPSLIATEAERRGLLGEQQGPSDNHTMRTFRVFARNRQSYYKYETIYDNWADVWNSFNNDYLYADFPRLMIRAEDTWLYPKQLMKVIADCAGMKLEGEFHYVTEKGKQDSRTDMLMAMVKYGRSRNRIPTQLTRQEREYLETTGLNPELMERLHYPLQLETEEEDYDALDAAVAEFIKQSNRTRQGSRISRNERRGAANPAA